MMYTCLCPLLRERLCGDVIQELCPHYRAKASLVTLGAWVPNKSWRE